MPLDELKHGIEAGARSEAESIRASAAQERKRILDDAVESAKGIESGSEKEAAAEIARMRQEQSAKIEREARVSVLEAIDDDIRRESKGIRAELESRLKKSERYGKLFKEALKRAQEMAPAEDLVVQVNKKDEHFLKSAGVKIEHADISGLIIRSRDMSVRIDATLDRMIDSSMDDAMTIIMSEISRASKAAGGRGAQRSAAPKRKAAAPAKRKKEKRASRKKAR